MLGAEFFDFPLWWIFPIIMIALCFFMMRRRRGSKMCGFGSDEADNHHTSDSDSALAILDKRYALGEVDKEEYEEKRRALNRAN